MSGGAERAPFEPLGERARWKVLYEALRVLKPGDEISYDRMGEMLGLDPDDDRTAIRVALHRAAQEFEREDRRALDAVRGRGYRVVEPMEHLRLARQHSSKATRATRRAESKVTNVDLSGESVNVQRGFEAVAFVLREQGQINRRVDRALRRHADALNVVATKVDRTGEEVSAMDQRMKDFEARLRAAEERREIPFSSAD